MQAAEARKLTVHLNALPKLNFVDILPLACLLLCCVDNGAHVSAVQAGA